MLTGIIKSTCTAVHSLAAQLVSLPSGLAGCASGRLQMPAVAAALPLSAPAGSAPAVPEHQKAKTGPHLSASIQ